VTGMPFGNVVTAILQKHPCGFIVNGIGGFLSRGVGFKRIGRDLSGQRFSNLASARIMHTQEGYFGFLFHVHLKAHRQCSRGIRIQGY
jgi:hypothetical protein